MIGEFDALDRAIESIRSGQDVQQQMALAYRILHRLAGSAGTFGLARLGDEARILELGVQQVLEERRPERGGEIYQYVRIRAEVRPAAGQPDPGFSVSLRLTDEDQTFVARSRLEESDEVIAEIKVSKDAYLTLFSVVMSRFNIECSYTVKSGIWNIIFHNLFEERSC